MEISLLYKALKWLIITMIAFLFCGGILAALQQFDRFIEWQVSWGDAIQVCLLASAAMFSSAVTCGSSIALVVIFRNTGKRFLPALAQSAVVIISLAAIVWLYGAHVQPRLTAKGVETIWNAQMEDPEYIKSYSQFLNSTPSTATRSVLCGRIDSLQTQIQFDGEDAQYQTRDELNDYRIERVKRMLNAVLFVITSLLFACLGYASRKVAIAKIFGIAAIIIVCIYMISYIYTLADLAGNM